MLPLLSFPSRLDGMSRTLNDALGLMICATLFWRTFVTARSLTVRQQLKWIVWGVSIAAAAFAVFYLPAWYSAPHEISTILGALAYAPLLLIPLTIGYSMLRYRLMDEAREVWR